MLNIIKGMMSMNKFDTYVQQLKYEVLKEVIKKAYDDDLASCYKDIPKKIEGKNTFYKSGNNSIVSFIITSSFLFRS